MIIYDFSKDYILKLIFRIIVYGVYKHLSY